MSFYTLTNIVDSEHKMREHNQKFYSSSGESSISLFLALAGFTGLSLLGLLAVMT